MKTSVLLTSSLLLLTSLAGDGVGWKNLDDEHRIGGRKLSEGYLRGKVVLVCRWNCDEQASRDLMPRMETIWNSFKSKQFALLGGHSKASRESAKSFVEEKHLTFSVYDDAGIATDEPEFPEMPFFYVIDETGKVRYKGRDERLATERLVMALTDMSSPKNVAMWQQFIDFELKVLPGRAFNRLTEFRKKFSKDGKKYDEEYKRLKNDSEVQKLAKLVAFAEMSRDFDPKNRNTKGKVDRTRIEMTIKKYEPLKESKNEQVSQETKNAIADLKWALAKFPG